MSKMNRCGNKYSNIIAPYIENRVPDGIITTLHPEGSSSNVQFDIEKRRALVRPEINYMVVVFNILIPVLVCFTICWWSVSYALVGLGLYFLIRLRGVLIFFIHVYQRYASDDIRVSCVFEPTCSEYMILALKKYGIIRGNIRGIKRLLRCHYPNGGKDYP